MSLYYFINCLILTFAPPAIVYKLCTGPESSSLWKTAIGCASYILTQLVKFTIIATLMVKPPIALDYAIDCIGMYLTLLRQPKAALNEVKVLSVAVGWSIGESLLNRLVNYYVNARAAGFDVAHLIQAVESNITLLQYISTCGLLFLCTRSSNSKVLPSIVLSVYLLSLNFVHSLIMYRILLTVVFAISCMFICSQNNSKVAI